MTTSLELKQLAKRLNIKLTGVYSKDISKIPFKNNTGIIINMENMYDSKGRPNKGSHWVAIAFTTYNNEKIAVYFDAFGYQPPNNIHNKLNDIDDYYLYSSKHIQDEDSILCGPFCIYFLWYFQHKNKHLSPTQRLKAFQKEFSNDTDANDRILFDKLNSLL